MKPIKTKRLGEVWVANQGDLSAIGVTKKAAIQGVKDCAETQPNTLNPPQTAPKDGTVILADFGWPWMLPAVWNEYDEKWATCTVQASPMEPDGKHDVYWETEQQDPGALAGWLPMPEVVRKRG